MRERSGRGEGGETSQGGREHNGVAMAAAATSVYLETRIVATLAHSAATRLCATCPWLSRYKHTERKRSDTKAEHERTLACVGGTGHRLHAVIKDGVCAKRSCALIDQSSEKNKGSYLDGVCCSH